MQIVMLLSLSLKLKPTNLKILKVLQWFAVAVQGRRLKVVKLVAKLADKTCDWN